MTHQLKPVMYTRIFGRDVEPYTNGDFWCEKCKLMGTPSLFKEYKCNEQTTPSV